MSRSVEDNRRHNFLIIDNEVLDLYGPHIGAIGVALYATLVRYAGTKTTCFPSHDTIASKIGVSRKTVVDYAHRLAGTDKGTILKEAGLPPLIAIHRRMRQGGGMTSHLYELLPVTKGDSHGVTNGASGCNPRLHEEDTGQEDSSPTETEMAEPENPKPENPARALVLALYNDVLGLDGPTTWPKAMRQAKSLVAAGCTPEEVRAIGRWLMGDSFWSSKGIDMGAIQSQRDKWRATQAKVAPSNPRQPTYANSVDPYEAQLLAGLEGEE